MLRESDLMKRLVSLAERNSHVIEGVAEQDDGAVIAIPADSDLCATTDFVRGTGFSLHQLGHLSLHELGRYVVAANVSDLAAMGANPLFYLSVIRYQPGRTLDEVEQIVRGVAEGCEEFGCPLVGGDSGSYLSDVLSGTAVGTLPRGRRLSRHTLQPGDGLMVSGKIGGAAAALAAANAGTHLVVPQAFAQALHRWRRPEPRVALGRALVDLLARVSCMDVSDGLTASLQQLSKITGHGFTINTGALPIGAGVAEIAGALDLDPVHLACSASVDFELLVACAPENVDAVMGAAKACGTPLTLIGCCEAGGSIRMERPGGGTYSELPGVPWDHQSDDLTRFFDAKG